MTKASELAETRVEQLALIFYKKGWENTKKPFYVKEINNLGNGQIGGTHATYTIDIPTSDGLTSGDYYLYAIANWGSAFCRINSPEAFKTMSIDDLKELVIAREGNNQLDIVGMTPMSGKYGPLDGDGFIEIKPKENTFTEAIHLRRAVAKIIVNIAPDAAGINFTPESYDIRNYSQSSTLIERTGWTNNTKPGDEISGNDGPVEQFLDIKFTEASPRQFTFYMLENVQKAKTVNGTLSEVAKREKRVSATDETFRYAPEKSTYIVIHGSYSGPIGSGNSTIVNGDVSYTIQLGDFNEGTDRGGIDNFTIRRNVKYTYNVKVQGVSSIVTEATAEDADAFENSERLPGAEGDLVALGDDATIMELDAHYSKVLLRIPKAKLSDPVFYVTTPFSRTKTGIQPSAAGAVITDDSKDCNWIHFSKPEKNADGSPTFGKFNSGSGLANVFDLLQELSAVKDAENGTEGAHYVVYNDYVYTTAYVDEYFYETNPNGGDLALADFINKPDRTMNICTTKSISKDGKSTYVANTIISFRQNSIHTVYPLNRTDADFVPFGIEKSNEWPVMNRTILDENQQKLLTDNDGWQNTKQLIGLTATGSYKLSEAGYKFAEGSKYHFSIRREPISQNQV